MDKKIHFTKKLLSWNSRINNRPMPWKGEKDPYKIWLSEIILQQTRVEQGWDYYTRFISVFPTVQKLATASETRVFKLWEGLGYYSRCKNLIATAKVISKEYGGHFPGTYQEILALKGVGPYTAAAISSFAFNLPHAVVDGNVFRVLARYFGLDMPIDSSEGKKRFTALAAELLDKKKPGIYNQAIMDFGAVCCKPRSPLCPACPLKNECSAYLNGMVKELPVKGKSTGRRTRWFYYFVAEFNGKVYVHKRGRKDIWENLYEFILEERTSATALEVLRKLPGPKNLLGRSGTAIAGVSEIYTRQLSHQVIHGQFIRVTLKKPPESTLYKAVSREKLKKLPFPVIISAYLRENAE